MIDQVCAYYFLAYQFGGAEPQYYIWWNPKEKSWVRDTGSDKYDKQVHRVMLSSWPGNGWDITLNYCELSWSRCAECDAISFLDFLCEACREHRG